MTQPLLPAPWMQASDIPVPSMRRLWVAAGLTIGLGFGGLGLWAGLATVKSAVAGNGVIISADRRKSISLPDNAILATMLVHEGSHVHRGQVLFTLDAEPAQTAYKQADALYWAAVARRARLIAESQDLRTLVFPPALVKAAQTDPDAAAAMDAEHHLFQTRWKAFDDTLAVNKVKVTEAQAQIAALTAQARAYATRLQLVDEAIKTAQGLMRQGLETRPHMLDLLGSQADYQGEIGQVIGQIAGTKHAIAQTDTETQGLISARASDISKDLADAEAAVADAGPKRAAASDLLAKCTMLAPEDGTITDIKSFTPGSSIEQGQPVMDLVPSDSPLVIEANTSPQDVEHLQVGQRVNVRLTSYKAHEVPVLPAHLTYVAADRQMDANNNPVIVVRAALDPHALDRYPGVVLTPGMPADVLIINGNRTVLNYLLGPISEGMHHGMVER